MLGVLLALLALAVGTAGLGNVDLDATVSACPVLLCANFSTVAAKFPTVCNTSGRSEVASEFCLDRWCASESAEIFGGDHRILAGAD